MEASSKVSFLPFSISNLCVKFTQDQPAPQASNLLVVSGFFFFAFGASVFVKDVCTCVFIHIEESCMFPRIYPSCCLRQDLSLACSSSIRPGWLARVPRIHLLWDYKQEPQTQLCLLGSWRPNSRLHALRSSSLLVEPFLKLQAQACQRHHFSLS